MTCIHPFMTASKLCLLSCRYNQIGKIFPLLVHSPHAVLAANSLMRPAHKNVGRRGMRLCSGRNLGKAGDGNVVDSGMR